MFSLFNGMSPSLGKGEDMQLQLVEKSGHNSSDSKVSGQV